MGEEKTDAPRPFCVAQSRHARWKGRVHMKRHDKTMNQKSSNPAGSGGNISPIENSQADNSSNPSINPSINPSGNPAPASASAPEDSLDDRPLLQGRLRFAWTTFLLSWLTGFGPLCTDMYLPTLPDIANELEVSAALVQGSITACLLGLALGQLVMGPMSDNRGRRSVLMGSLILYTVSSFMCALAASGPSFLVWRFLQGFGGAGGAVLSRAICCDMFRGSRLTQYISLLMAINSIAPILGPVVGGFLGGWAGWRAVFHLLGGIGVALFVGILFGLPETLPKEKRLQGGILASIKNTFRLARERAYLCYIGVSGFTMGGFFAYVSASPFIFQKIYGCTMQEYSLIFAANGVGLVLTSLAAGWLARRFGDKNLLRAGDFTHAALAVVLFFFCLFLPESPWPFAVALFFFIAVQNFTMSPSFSLAIACQRVGAGAASGILGVTIFLFGAVTSPLVGLAGEESAVPLGIIVLLTSLASLGSTLLGNRLFEKYRVI